MNIADSLYIAAHQLKQSESLKSVRVMDDRFLLLQTVSGDLIVIYLINVELSLSDIKKALTDNTAQNIFTLFVISADLIPADGQTVEFMSYLKALHTIYHEKIYVYRADEHGIVIFPVHFRPQSQGADYQAIYRSPIDLRHLMVEHIETGYPVNGFWATAHFKQKVDNAPDSQSQRRPFDDFFHQQYEKREQGHSGSSRKSAKNLSLRRHYQILGITLHATEEEIRGAYRQLARQYHPDLNTAPSAKERMQEINLAYREIMRQFD
jgi:hypothetical protein